MKRSVGRGLAALVAVVGLAAGGWLVANRAAVTGFPRMPSSYEAKEYCSCRWVSGRDDTFCAHFVAQSVVPTQGREVDEANRRVTARALGIRSSARWVGPREGCRVEPPSPRP